MALVINIFTKEKTYPVELSEEPFTVGRSRHCDFTIEDSKCSGNHCQFQIVSGKAVVKDLNSSNGTYLDDIIVNESFIKINQKIKIGQTTIQLDEDEMTSDEYEVHQFRDDRKKQKVLDLEGELREHSLMASEVLKRAKATRIFVNRKHLKKSEQEKLKMGESRKSQKESRVRKELEQDLHQRNYQNKKISHDETGVLKSILGKIKDIFFH